jgi:hypothetical protein
MNQPAIIVTIAALLMLIRAMLILIGLYKTPILKTFEEYGPDEKPYLAGLPVLVWAGLMVFSITLWGAPIPGLSVTMNCLGVTMLLLGGAGYFYRDQTAKYHLMFMRLPRWYHRLLAQTTRYERRRIGYMWLHLPPRLRLTYNSSDKLFFIWADFVIMGTVREEEFRPGDDEFLYTRH